MIWEGLTNFEVNKNLDFYPEVRHFVLVLNGNHNGGTSVGWPSPPKKPLCWPPAAFVRMSCAVVHGILRGENWDDHPQNKLKPNFVWG